MEKLEWMAVVCAGVALATAVFVICAQTAFP